MRNLEFQKSSGKMAGIHGTSALWPSWHHGQVPVCLEGWGQMRGRSFGMQLWDATAMRKSGAHLKSASTP